MQALRTIASHLPFHKKVQENQKFTAPVAAFANVDLSTLRDHLNEAVVVGFKRQATSTGFDPNILMPEAQKDMLGDRGFKDVKINQKELVKINDSNPDYMEIHGLFITCIRPQKPNADNVACISKFPSVSLRRNCIENRDGTTSVRISFINFELPEGATDVCINGYPVEGCLNTASLSEFLSNTGNLKLIMGRALAIRILNGMLPAGTAYEVGCELFSQMKELNSRATEVFQQRIQLIQQRLGNALLDGITTTMSETMPESVALFLKADNDSYSITVKNPNIRQVCAIPNIASDDFTTLLQRAEICISLSANIFAAMPQPNGEMPYQLIGTAAYQCSINVLGVPDVHSVTLINLDGSSRTTG